jgi:hypothetical protein
VTAFNEAGQSDPTAIACIDIAPEVPVLPQAVSIEVVDGLSMRLSWSLPLFSYTALRVERADSVAGAWNEVFSTSNLVVTYLDEGLEPASEYCYRLETTNDAGSSGFTAPVCAFTNFAVPPPPFALGVIGNEDGSIQVTWSQDPSPRILFRLERQEGAQRFDVLSDSLRETSFLDTDLREDLVYCYRVRSFNPQFASDYSETACGIVAPARPSDVTAAPETARPTSELSVSWMRGDGAAADAYLLEYRPAASADFSETVRVDDTTYTLTGLEDATSYVVRVRGLRSLDNTEAISEWVETEGTTFLSFWPGDINGDGSVTAEDVVVLLGPSCYGQTTSFSTAGNDVSWVEIPVDASNADPALLRCDADRNGIVEIFDFLAIAANAGRTTGRVGSVQSARIVSETHRRRIADLLEDFTPSPDDSALWNLRERLVEILTSHSQDAELPETPKLLTVFPNPAPATASVQLGIPQASEVAIDVIDNIGRPVVRIRAGIMEAGIHTVPFRTNGLAPGHYFIRMQTPGTTRALPLIVTR